jgi:hypothetical protein
MPLDPLQCRPGKLYDHVPPARITRFFAGGVGGHGRPSVGSDIAYAIFRERLHQPEDSSSMRRNTLGSASAARRTWGPAVFSLFGIGVMAGSSGAGCYSGNQLGGSPAPSSSTASGGPDAGIPFQADSPQVYVAKVKNILTGLAPTSDELNQVVADPTALSALVTKWQTDPTFAPFYQAKMQVFFELAFQQTQISTADFAQMIPQGGGIGVSGTLTNLLVQNVRESFARTMVSMVTQNQPFTQSLTTNQFMMTPPLMELYAFLDSNQIRDDESTNDRFKAANAGINITLEASAGAIPLADTLDSTNPNYMHWYYPDIAAVTNTAPDCNVDPRTYPATADTMHLLMYGSLQNYKGTAKSLTRNSRRRTSARGSSSPFANRARMKPRRRSSMHRRCARQPSSFSPLRVSDFSRRPRSSPIGRRTRATRCA